MAKECSSSPKESSRGSKSSEKRQQSLPKTAVDSCLNANQFVGSKLFNYQGDTLHEKIDLLMGLVQEMAPVVKTLQEREATLLNVGTMISCRLMVRAMLKMGNLRVNEPKQVKRRTKSPVLTKWQYQRLPPKVRLIPLLLK